MMKLPLPELQIAQHTLLYCVDCRRWIRRGEPFLVVPPIRTIVFGNTITFSDANQPDDVICLGCAHLRGLCDAPTS